MIGRPIHAGTIRSDAATQETTQETHGPIVNAAAIFVAARNPSGARLLWETSRIAAILFEHGWAANPALRLDIFLLPCDCQ